MSSSIRFNHGGSFLLDGREVSIVRVINGDLVTLEDIASLVVYQYSKNQLLDLWAAGRITPKPVANPPSVARLNHAPSETLCNYQQKAIDDALRRKKYLDALIATGKKIVFSPGKLKPLLEQIALQFKDPMPPAPVTVYRWFKKKLQHDDHPLALIEKPFSRGWFGCRFPLEVQEVLIERIETLYLKGPGCSIVDLHDDLRVKIHALNQVRAAGNALALPSYDTVRRAVMAYPAYEQAVAKFGKQEASLRFRTSLATPKAEFILEAAEVDHTPVDLFVVDEKTGMPLGRPWLTAIIDRKSRMILGIYVSFGGPSTEAVFGCLRNAILPKSYVSERYPRVESTWPCFGLMQILVCDNGLEFHSLALEQACFELGIILQFCPKRKPYFKGMIERALGSILDCPGSCRQSCPMIGLPRLL